MHRTRHNSRKSLPFLTAAITFLFTLPCFATDVAVLRNGFSIKHERREIIGAMTRLFVGSDRASYVDVPSLDIDHFEAVPPENEAAKRSSSSKSTADSFQATSLNVTPADLNAVVGQASERYRLDPDLVNSVIKAESGFNVRARSRKGAQGLMQLMPGTASKLGVPNAYDPQANVEGGTRYLRELLERYNFDLIKALAAYNAGPRRVEQYGGIPPYFETHAYVSRIVRDFNRKKLAQRRATPVASQKAEPAKKKSQAATTRPHPSSTTRVSQASTIRPSE